jgi:hypothetical protein
MMKKLLIAVFILASVSAAFPAPWSSSEKPALRIWGGLDRAKYSGQPSVYTVPEISIVEQGPRTGASFGAGLEIPVPQSVLSLVTEINYLQKGEKELQYYLNELQGEISYQLDTLGLTGMIKARPSRVIPVFVLVGYGISYILRHKLGELDLLSETRNYDHGLVVGGGVEGQCRNLKLFLETRYHYGVANLLSHENYPYSKFGTRALILGFGLKFRL